MVKTINILLVALYLAYSFGRGETGECSVLEDGTTECLNDRTGERGVQQRKQHPAKRCQAPTSLYSWGGTAVAYRPNTNLQTNICSNNTPTKKYNVANWFGRRASWAHAPRISLQINVYGCSDQGASDETCNCRKLEDDSLISVEVWQTQSDGTYPSLRSNEATQECRAKQIGSSVTFETVAPGSVGSMGGLGPSGWDIGPYRSPVIHILVRGASSFAATLVDLPMSIHQKTLAKKSFWGPDFSGTAWTRSREAKDAKMYQISGWKPILSENRVQVEVDIFVPRSKKDDDKDRPLCPSLLYGFPKSFFTEPITICAPSLLNFFPL